MNKATVKYVLGFIQVCLFVVPFLPLYISQDLFFPFITGKAFAFRALIEMAFAAWAWLAIMHKVYRPRKSAVLIAISVWLLVVAAASVLGVNPLRSFWSNFERMEGLVAYMHWFMYFVVVISIFNWKDWMRHLNLFVVAGIFENTYVFLQWLGILASPQGGTGRADGTIGNPTYLAAYLIFIFGIASYLWLKSKRESAESYFYAGMSVWTLASIYFTASRGPVLGLLIGLILAAVVYLIFAKNEFSRFINKKTVGIGLISIVAVPLAFWLLRDTKFVLSSPALSRLTSLSFSERTVTSRFSIWAMSFEGFKEHPVLGWGPENYAIVFSKYFRPELWRQEPWFDRSHDIIFDWLINAGLLGLISYLSIFGAAFYLLWKSYLNKYFALEDSLLFGALLVAYFFQNLFVFDNFATYLSFFAVLGFIHFAFCESELKINPEANAGSENRRDRIIKKTGAGDDEIMEIMIPFGLLAVFGATMYFINIVPLMTNLSLLDALRYQDANPQQGLDDYQKAVSNGYLGKQEVREQMTRFAISAGGSPNLPAEFKDKVIRATIDQLSQGINENLLDPRPYLFLSGLYSRIGLTDQAFALLDSALKLSPKKQQIYFEVADLYMQKGDYQNSIKTLETAFNLDKEYNQALYNLVAAYILNGDQNKADALLIESLGTVDVPNQILVQVYSIRKDYKRLIGIWQAFVKISPVNLDYRKSLSGAYLLAGDKADAVKVLKDAINDFPSFAKEGGDLIAQTQSGK